MMSRLHTSMLLTGPSGVGKSTVGRALQARLSEGWLLFDVDRCGPLHPPLDSFATAENDLALTRATLAAAAVYVDHGFRVIIEIDVASPSRRALVLETLGDTPIILLMCSESSIRARAGGRTERAGGRYPVVDPEWALDHWRNGGWDRLDADLIVMSDNRSAVDVADEVADFIVGMTG